MSASLAAAAGKLDRLEAKLYAAYDNLGISRTPLQPIDRDDPASIELHLQWIEKELQLLDKLLSQQTSARMRPKTWRQRLDSLSPARLSGTLAHVGLTPPPDDIDPFGLDNRMYLQLRPLIRRLFEDYWRVEVDGLQHIPANGAAILVANHGGVLPFDALMLRYAIQEMHPAGRIPRFLLEDWFMTMPAINVLLQRLGAVRGSQQNASRLIADGQLVGLFPEGAKGVTKRFRDRYRIQRFGRGGTIRLALHNRVPLIPVGVVGNEETYPMLAKLGLPRANTDFDFLPLTPLFPHFGLLGLTPLPSKWLIRFGEPLDLSSFPAETADDDITVNTLNEELRQRVQDLVNHLLQRRRSPWLG